MNNHQESTYALLIRSEEKSRSALEGVIYSTFILSVVVAICQFVQQPVHIPASGIEPGFARAGELAAVNSPI